MKDNHRAKPEEATAAATETGLGHDTITATVAQWLTVLHDALKDAAAGARARSRSRRRGSRAPRHR